MIQIKIPFESTVHGPVFVLGSSGGLLREFICLYHMVCTQSRVQVPSFRVPGHCFPKCPPKWDVLRNTSKITWPGGVRGGQEGQVAPLQNQNFFYFLKIFRLREFVLDNLNKL